MGRDFYISQGLRRGDRAIRDGKRDKYSEIKTAGDHMLIKS